jgi:hypothetical protein
LRHEAGRWAAAACTGEAGNRPAPPPITIDQDEIMQA